MKKFDFISEESKFLIFGFVGTHFFFHKKHRTFKYESVDDSIVGFSFFMLHAASFIFVLELEGVGRIFLHAGLAIFISICFALYLRRYSNVPTALPKRFCGGGVISWTSQIISVFLVGWVGFGLWPTDQDVGLRVAGEMLIYLNAFICAYLSNIGAFLPIMCILGSGTSIIWSLVVKSGSPLMLHIFLSFCAAILSHFPQIRHQWINAYSTVLLISTLVLQAISFHNDLDFVFFDQDLSIKQGGSTALWLSNLIFFFTFMRERSHFFPLFLAIGSVFLYQLSFFLIPIVLMFICAIFVKPQSIETKWWKFSSLLVLRGAIYCLWLMFLIYVNAFTDFQLRAHEPYIVFLVIVLLFLVSLAVELNHYSGTNLFALKNWKELNFENIVLNSFPSFYTYLIVCFISMLALRKHKFVFGFWILQLIVCFFLTQFAHFKRLEKLQNRFLLLGWKLLFGLMTILLVKMK